MRKRKRTSGKKKAQRVWSILLAVILLLAAFAAAGFLIYKSFVPGGVEQAGLTERADGTPGETEPPADPLPHGEEPDVAAEDAGETDSVCSDAPLEELYEDTDPFAEGSGESEAVFTSAGADAPVIPEEPTEPTPTPEPTATPEPTPEPTPTPVPIPETVTVLGKDYPGTTEELDLTGTKFSSAAEIESIIGAFPLLKKIIVSGCGLPDETLGALDDQYENVRVVWTLDLRGRSLRTDAPGFSTANPGKYENGSESYNKKVRACKRLYPGDIDCLKYCKDLVALDLGHNYLEDSDLAVIAEMKDLQILILADNKFHDLSPLSGLKKLVYVEVFMNSLKSAEPFGELPELLDLNITKTGITDLSPLTGLTKLERLWAGLNNIKKAEGEKLSAAIPNCTVNITVRSATEDGWRDHERYTWMRSYFK